MVELARSLSASMYVEYVSLHTRSSSLEGLLDLDLALCSLRNAREVSELIWKKIVVVK